MTDLDKAREWAKSVGKIEDLMSEPRAAVEVIKSLPDQWVDVDELLGVLFHMREDSLFEESLRPHVNALERLLTPKLPTLADMTDEERAACKWMQAQVFPTASTLGIITCIDEYERSAIILFTDGIAKNLPWEDIAPLTGEPKLQWPGGVVDAEIVEEPEPVDAPPAEKAALPKPEDVPPNEPWLIEANGQKAIGTRYKGDAVLPWFVAALDGSFADDYHDSVVTLIHKLVPEPPALPEGMRLADHEKYGRVVVSKKKEDEHYRIFFTDEEDRTESAWDYVQEGTFTFLDGGHHF